MATRGIGALEPQQGAWAVGYARDVVESVVTDDGPVPEPSTVDDVFRADRGAFVTLEKNGELRGCIGRPYPEQSAVQALREAATGAAAEDPRFPPVAPAELDTITVEVSILTAPDPLDADRDALADEISIGRDGLIVRQGERRGLLLPQVPAERGWNPVTFLDQTSRKAGLPPGSWRDPETVVERFTAQVFAETAPDGPVEEATPGGTVE